MSGRYRQVRARLVFIVTILFAFMALGMIYVQTQIVDRNAEVMHRSQRISAVKMVQLYVNLSIPGDWEVVDGRLRKGGRDFGDGSFITHALSEYLLPDTMIRFKLGTPPKLPKKSGLAAFLYEPPRAGDAADDPRRRGSQDDAFMTEFGAGIAVSDDAGLPIGWIEASSDRDQRRLSSNRLFSTFLTGASLLSLLAIAFFCAVVFKLTRPIDVMAEEHECAEERNAELSAKSRTDPLTGLLNRRGLEEAIDAIGASEPLPTQLALLDIDHFKAINDARGHDEGDRALASVARVIARTVRAGDLCCRWGGEEFVVVFRGLEGEHASVSAERLREAVEAEILGDEESPLRLTVTIGLAKWRSAGFAEALAQADAAMYRGKREGRNRVVVA